MKSTRDLIQKQIKDIHAFEIFLEPLYKKFGLLSGVIVWSGTVVSGLFVSPINRLSLKPVKQWVVSLKLSLIMDVCLCFIFVRWY